MGLRTYIDYRLKNIGQELYSFCPIFYNQRFYDENNGQLVSISKHNEIWKIKKGSDYYILKKAINNNNIIINNNKLIEEGRKLKRLRHENIIKCHKIYNYSDVYLLLEYIEGNTLEHILKSRRLNISFIYKITVELLTAVNYLHEKNIIHNDLNPSNLIFSHKENKIVVIDLGIATYASSRKNQMGAEQFSAPEQLLKQKTTFKTDVWAIGCILFYCIEGHRPFRRKYEQFYKDKPVILKCIPKSFKTLILSMLEKDPHKRPTIPESMEEINKLKEFYK
ncbi:serine/threonine protein kinase [Staphylococcus ursi]|uniref:serine/threonine-protein kinase n=1 Tax=Staphylococcus sp. MI 10-1553 TaxID=1912064 RepID=UPI00139893F8|nr:serine/threonine-protein kinase [Staphylococcus sp. MI 10-1553]QHW37052.1 serine/threonine protein kinase [Staphylococcus sp. MI 10-1553]